MDKKINTLLLNPTLSYAIIDKKKNHFGSDQWSRLCQNHKLSSTFMKKYMKYIDWYVIESRDDLTQHFINTYHKKLDMLVVLISNSNLDYTRFEYLQTYL